jgi:hypothetical protein
MCAHISDRLLFRKIINHRVKSAKLIALRLTIPLNIKYFRVIEKKVCSMT